MSTVIRYMRAHGVHAHRDRGLSEQSCSLPQTRRRAKGKERAAGAVEGGEARDIRRASWRERGRGGQRRASEQRNAQFGRGERRGDTCSFSRSTLRTHSRAASCWSSALAGQYNRRKLCGIFSNLLIKCAFSDQMRHLESEPKRMIWNILSS